MFIVSRKFCRYNNTFTDVLFTLMNLKKRQIIFRYINSASLSYIVWNFDLNWLTFLEAMQENRRAPFISNHSVCRVVHWPAWQFWYWVNAYISVQLILYWRHMKHHCKPLPACRRGTRYFLTDCLCQPNVVPSVAVCRYFLYLLCIVYQRSDG